MESPESDGVGAITLDEQVERLTSLCVEPSFEFLYQPAPETRLAGLQMRREATNSAPAPVVGAVGRTDLQAIFVLRNQGAAGISSCNLCYRLVGIRSARFEPSRDPQTAERI